MKPSGKVELLIISAKNCGHSTVPHIVALLGSTFHAAKIRTLSETSKLFAKKYLIQPNKYLFIFGQVVGNVYLCARLRKK